MEVLNVGILTISDRVMSGEYEDLSGQAIRSYLNENLKSNWEEKYIVVSDDFSEIKRALMQLTGKYNCSLVLTTGGTGPASRDVTPEATESVCARLLPGFGELMRSESLKTVPTAILSRQTAGIRGSSLIINLPGKPESIKVCLSAVFPAVPDCLKLIGDLHIETNDGNTKIYH